jgi:SAM-dependent methyltransferase
MTRFSNSAALVARQAIDGTSPSLSGRVSDVWRAPLTDLPVRDELIRQYVPLSTPMEVLEVGPGSGFTSFRLARTVSALTLLEVAPDSAAGLRRRLAHKPNVQVVQDDLCRPGLGQEHASLYDASLAIEVLEFLPDPATGLRNMAEMLRSGGHLYMQFPNYESKNWPTSYSTRRALETHLSRAGFTSWEIYSLRLSPWSQILFHWLHEVPLRLYRECERVRQRRPQSPQSYDETWAFHHASKFEALKVPIHFCWAAIILLMRLGGDVFRRVDCGDEILGRNLFVVATVGQNGSTEL